MSIGLEMLQVARLAPKLLGDSTPLVANFFLSQQNEDGGFKDRDGRSDLYYTVFGLSGLLSLDIELVAEKIACVFDGVGNFLHSFGEGDGLDFVHLCCFARCWSAITLGIVPANVRSAILRRIEDHRSRDGGFNSKAGSEHETAYASFLALGAYQDLNSQIPDSLRMVQSLKFLETSDGAWTNERSPRATSGSTNATAAAVNILRNLGMPINPALGDWLLARAHPRGGFRAAPDSPIPDLLSTATAIHALAGLQISFEHLRENCLDFIDTLWTNEGGFHGHWADDHLDCEYTFYGLLALGHLSL